MIGCSAGELSKRKSESEEKLKEIYIPDLRMDILKLHSWVNLMPGTKSRFHITGSLLVKKDFKYDLNMIELKNIKIFQKNRLIFTIKPEVIINKDNSNADMVNFVFSTIKGLFLKSNFNSGIPVDVEFIFYDGENDYSYIVDNVKVDEAH